MMLSPRLRALLVVVIGLALGVVAFRLTEATEPPAQGEAAAAPTSITEVPRDSSSLPEPSSTTTTTSTTIPTTEPDPALTRGWLVIHGTGDVSFDPSYIPNLAAHGYEFAFGGLEGLFRDDHLTVINLECTPSMLGSPTKKEFVFRCPPEALPVAHRHGVDVANLANNHAQDHGTEAMLAGRNQLASAGIHPVGVGVDLAEAIEPALIEAQGWTVAVLGMGGVVPGPLWLATEEQPGMASGDDTAQMVAAVRAASEVADLVVVTIHWGWELETEPRSDDRERAEAMVDAGADVIFGHHPHRLGSLEMVRGRPVFWTLGNFIWPRLSDAGATTAVARVVVSPEGETSACLLPAFIERSGQPVLVGARWCGPADPGWQGPEVR